MPIAAMSLDCMGGSPCAETDSVRRRGDPAAARENMTWFHA
jgi:hypothetical protein